jgi:hypothetical protein
MHREIGPPTRPAPESPRRTTKHAQCVSARPSDAWCIDYTFAHRRQTRAQVEGAPTEATLAALRNGVDLGIPRICREPVPSLSIVLASSLVCCEACTPIAP